MFESTELHAFNDFICCAYRVISLIHLFFIYMAQHAHCSVIIIQPQSNRCISCMGRKKLRLTNEKPADETDNPDRGHVPKRKKTAPQRINDQCASSSAKIDVAQNADQTNDGVDEAAQEFHDHVMDMWLRNQGSSKFVQSLSAKAEAAGAKGVTKLVEIGNKGSAPKNLARDLKRHALHGTKKPPVYEAPIEVWNQADGTKETVHVPFILIHEQIWNLVQHGMISLATLCSVTVGSALADMKNRICEKLEIADPDSHMMMGMHSDGVPCQKSAQGSIEVLSFNFANMPCSERMLFGYLEKHFFCRCGCKGRHTFDSIMQIVSWMMFCFFCLFVRHQDTTANHGENLMHGVHPWQG